MTCPRSSSSIYIIIENNGVPCTAMDEGKHESAIFNGVWFNERKNRTVQRSRARMG